MLTAVGRNTDVNYAKMAHSKSMQNIEADHGLFGGNVVLHTGATTAAALSVTASPARILEMDVKAVRGIYAEQYSGRKT
jgi:hypothetical protein